MGKGAKVVEIGKIGKGLKVLGNICLVAGVVTDSFDIYSSFGDVNKNELVIKLEEF